MLPGIITGLLIVLFLAGWAWAWSPRRKRAFDDAARLPLQEAFDDAQTRFRFEHNLAGQTLRGTIDIHDLQGRLVKTIAGRGPSGSRLAAASLSTRG